MGLMLFQRWPFANASLIKGPDVSRDNCSRPQEAVAGDEAAGRRGVSPSPGPTTLQVTLPLMFWSSLVLYGSECGPWTSSITSPGNW